jgi:beta-lactam-binding protein with PASTA domain
LPYLGVFIVFYFLATMGTIRFLVRSGTDVVVPNLVGLSRADAEVRLAAANLRLTVQGELFSDQIPPGQILQQSIAPSEHVREGRGVGALLSKGPRARSVPRLIGLDSRAVSVVLGSSNLKVEKTVQSCSESVPAGLVIAQDPRPGDLTASNQVQLLESDGKCFGRFVMQDFTGASYKSTAHVLERRGFSVGFEKEDVTDAEEGTILSQEPTKGSLVSLGDPIRFAVASRALSAEETALAAQSSLIFFPVKSSPAFFRKEAKLRLEREPPLGSSTIDFLLTPGNNSDFVFWLSAGSEVVVTVNGEETLRKTYPWR